MPANDQLSCPMCGGALNLGDFMCVRCEVIVNPSALVEDDFEPPREPTLVRALLCPEPTLSRERPRPKATPPPPPPEAGLKVSRRAITRTRVFAIPAGSDDIPSLLLGLDLKQLTITSFEAYVISLIDGRSTVEQLRMMAGLSKIETQSMLRSLMDRKIIAISEPPPKPKPAAPREPPRPTPRAPQAPSAPARTPPAPAVAPTPAVAPVPAVRVPPPPRRPVAAPLFNPLQKAIELERDGDFAGAIKVLEHGIARSSDPAPLFNRLAIALVKERRDLVEAESLIHRALELDPDNEVYHQNLLKVLSMAAALTGRHPMPKKRGR